MTDTELREKLQRIVKEAGNLRQAGQWLQLDHAYLWRVIHGHKRPGKKLLAALALTETGRTYAAVQAVREAQG